MLMSGGCRWEIGFLLFKPPYHQPDHQADGYFQVSWGWNPVVGYVLVLTRFLIPLYPF